MEIQGNNQIWIGKEKKLSIKHSVERDTDRQTDNTFKDGLGWEESTTVRESRTNCLIDRQRDRRKERETQIDKSMEATVRETQKIVN